MLKVAWSSRRRRFAANVATIEQRWPNIAGMLRQWDQQGAKYELYQAPDGNYLVRDGDQPDPAGGWLGGLRNHQQDAALFTFDKNATPTPHPIIFDGIGYGWLLNKVLSSTENSYLNYSCAVYILESDPCALAMVLHMHDLQSWLAHPRVRLFAGPGAQDDFTAAIGSNPTWTPPQQYIANRLTNRPAIDLNGLCRQLNNDRQQQSEAIQARVNKIYAGRDAAYWHKKFAAAIAGKRPLRVLGITTRYSTVLQYSMAELGRAVEAAGHQFKMSMEADDQSMERPDLQLLAEFQPDLLLQISRMRYELPWLPPEMPYICWDQDNLPCMRSPRATASLNALTYVAGYGATHGFLELNWPKRNCIFCYPAAANHTYHATPIPQQNLTPFICDFSYVSNAWQPARAMRDAVLADWAGNKGLADLFARISDEIITRTDAGERWDSEQVRSLVCKYGATVGLSGAEPVITELMMQGIRISDRAYRHAGLRWVADWCRNNNKTLRLYGRGWENNPEFAAFAAGPAAPGEHLRGIYQATRINLQIIETGVLHSRALDGMAAGGFFLCREFYHEPTYQGRPDAWYYQQKHELAQLAIAAGYDGITDLERSGEADLLERWSRIKSWVMAGTERHHFDKAFHIWAAFARPRQLLPQLQNISFNDPARFAELANLFLNDDTLRRSTAQQMRRAVLEHLSYDARWKTFMETVVAGLSSETQSQPTRVTEIRNEPLATV